jgi:hypothetical protein
MKFHKVRGKYLRNFLLNIELGCYFMRHVLKMLKIELFFARVLERKLSMYF